jgi:hypothetical protein
MVSAEQAHLRFESRSEGSTDTKLIECKIYGHENTTQMQARRIPKKRDWAAQGYEFCLGGDKVATRVAKWQDGS